MAALDKNNGTVIWEALDEGVGHASPICAEVNGVHQVIFLTATAGVGLAPHDGRLLWRYPWKTTFDLNVATPVVAEISRTQVFAEETLTWTVPVLAGGRLFVRHQNGLRALDLKRDRPD